MTKLITIVFLLSFITCQGVDKNKDSKENFPSDSVLTDKLSNIKDSGIVSNNTIPYNSDSSLFCKVDTLEITDFWNKFIKALKTKNKKVIFESLSFDLFLGSLISTPNFMKNCDTVLLKKSDAYYGISKLTEKNFDQYFDTIFNKNFIKLISAIKIDSIMKNGDNTGYSYIYSYSPNLKDFPCSHEKVVVINLIYCKGYRITIDFCC